MFIYIERLEERVLYNLGIKEESVLPPKKPTKLRQAIKKDLDSVLLRERKVKLEKSVKKVRNLCIGS